MAFAIVQASALNTSSGTSGNITLSSSAQNNLVVVHIRIASTVETVTSITDNVGNTYVIGTGLIGGTTTQYQGYGVQVVGAATTITVNFSSSVSFRIGADEYSGGAITNATVIDQSATATGTGTSMSLSLSPSTGGKLIVATVQTAAIGTFSAGTNYTLSLNSGTAQTLVSMYRLSGSTSETAPATNTQSGAWSEMARSYNPFLNSAILTGMMGMLE